MSPLSKEAQEMLLKWESGDPDTVSLWEQMNQWVYSGFEITYKNLGVDFDYFVGFGVVKIDYMVHKHKKMIINNLLKDFILEIK